MFCYSVAVVGGGGGVVGVDVVLFYVDFEQKNIRADGSLKHLNCPQLRLINRKYNCNITSDGPGSLGQPRLPPGMGYFATLDKRVGVFVSPCCYIQRFFHVVIIAVAFWAFICCLYNILV